MRPTVIPQALNGQPFRTAEAYALGVSLKMLHGGRFRRIAKGVYVAATMADSHRIQVRGLMLTLPPGAIATGVTGLHLLGVEVGPLVPMTFATTHPAAGPAPRCKGDAAQATAATSRPDRCSGALLVDRSIDLESARPRYRR